ncbi:uncharacterized protein BCR38DRAFT_516932 [Pseudomassariella vexata]|uniref:Uncharacterized protein n=1 Tax=Pseudomassariella vexata TaxID=1141098 RepID=A0A1Y2DW21_9PEZI|nr:uncharacterized protein BCR38DRAFT_516932 [Pseudomassariella vexata]ORY63481.1 hypothetical protein BCR38DRAFT_516932 [Pseudomassariella vexata]
MCPVLDALFKWGLFTVTFLQRASSTSSPALEYLSVRVKCFDSAMSFDSLAVALQGQDAAIACFPPKEASQHLRLCDAAAAAEVQRFIPADYGSCYSSSAQAQELDLHFLNKTKPFSYTSLVAGNFFDWGLRENFLHFDLKAWEVYVLDDGTYRSSTSTQLEVLASLKKATGTNWEANWVKSEDFIRDNKAKADRDDKEAVEHVVFAFGAIDGDWEKKEGFAMEFLGIEEERFDEVVKEVS